MPRPTDRSIDRRNEPNDPPLTRLSASIHQFLFFTPGFFAPFFRLRTDREGAPVD